MGVAIFLVTFGIRDFFEFMTVVFETTFNGMKSGLLWLVAKENRRNAVQRKFDTDMKWHEVRWDIARKEHELFPKDEWTHDVLDCVDVACNPEFLYRTASGSISRRPYVRRSVPVLPAPPPPPPPARQSRGGPVTARPPASPIPGNPEKH